MAFLLLSCWKALLVDNTKNRFSRQDAKAQRKSNFEHQTSNSPEASKRLSASGGSNDE